MAVTTNWYVDPFVSGATVAELDCALAGTMRAPLARRTSRQIKSRERRMESHGLELAEEAGQPGHEALGVRALKHTTPRN